MLKCSYRLVLTIHSLRSCHRLFIASCTVPTSEMLILRCKEKPNEDYTYHTVISMSRSDSYITFVHVLCGPESTYSCERLSVSVRRDRWTCHSASPIELVLVEVRTSL